MPAYSSFERGIARLLERHPALKQNIKKSYQYFCYLTHKPKQMCVVHPDCTLSPVQESAFWGYYDKSPCKNGRYLCHCFSGFSDVRKAGTIDILFDGAKISETSTWNWQQGAMCTWIDGKTFVHNFFDGSYKAKIINTAARTERIIDFPVYAVAKDGSFSISLNFTRLARLRPDYGYFNLPYADVPKIDGNDGVYFVDLKNNTRRLIISLNDLLALNPRLEMNGSWHKVNHIEISPDDKRFIFHHRWFDEQGRKWSRLISANVDGSDLFVLSDDTMVSHCCWRSNSEIAGWMRKKGNGDHYYLLKDKTSDYEIIGGDCLKEDGHPSFSADGRYMLTDTYPDRSRLQHLYLYDMQKKENIELGAFFSSLKYYGEERCDLHPRFNPSGNAITFDSVFSGIRSLYEIDISKLVSR